MYRKPVKCSLKPVFGCRGSAVWVSIALAAGSLLVVSCGGSGSSPTAGLSHTSPSPIESIPAHGEGAPRVDWDHPFGIGSIDITADATDPAAMEARGGLTFAPVVPRFGLAPFIVQSSSTQSPPGDREMVFGYNFGTGPDFPVSGHVSVLETGYISTPMDVAGRVRVDSETNSGVSEIYVGNSIPAYFDVNSVENNAELEMTVPTSAGYVEVDIYGQSLPPSTCKKLANTFAS